LHAFAPALCRTSDRSTGGPTEDPLDTDAREAYDRFERTLRCAAGHQASPKLSALSENAGRAYASALFARTSEARWTVFVQAVSAYLDELDAGIGIAIDPACGMSRHELRDIVYENDDLLENRGQTAGSMSSVFTRNA
jgi:hypothetical protein